ncbi:MAG: hypothetical protein HQM11_14815 [SAR324 cluster bacterium]|nr:hypothetical protein [SAR324 cluster bacterium]
MEVLVENNRIVRSKGDKTYPGSQGYVCRKGTSIASYQHHHQMPQAPNVLREFSSNPEKLLVVIDPRKSETARVANIHLALRPGTDALLTRAMIATITQS